MPRWWCRLSGWNCAWNGWNVMWWCCVWGEGGWCMVRIVNKEQSSKTAKLKAGPLWFLSGMPSIFFLICFLRMRKRKTRKQQLRQIETRNRANLGLWIRCICMETFVIQQSYKRRAGTTTPHWSEKKIHITLWTYKKKSKPRKHIKNDQWRWKGESKEIGKNTRITNKHLWSFGGSPWC